MSNKIFFLCDSEVVFYDPETRRKRPIPYGSDYAGGTTIEIKGFLSGNPKEIRFYCLDGDIGSVKTDHVKII